VDVIRSSGDATIRGGALPDTLPILPEPFSTGGIESTIYLGLAASPNPASARTIFRYSLPGAIPGSILIFDVSGRLMQSIDLPPQDATGGSINWDLRDNRGQVAGTGMYFARLLTPVGVRTIRFAVLR